MANLVKSIARHRLPIECYQNPVTGHRDMRWDVFGKGYHRNAKDGCHQVAIRAGKCFHLNLRNFAISGQCSS